MRSFLDKIIYEKKLEAKYDNMLSNRNLRETIHELRFKNKNTICLKLFRMNEEYKLVNELVSYFEERK